MDGKKKIIRQNSPRYSEAFKRKVIEEYLRTGESKLKLQRRYGINFKSGIVTWMKKLGYDDIHQKKAYFELLNSIILKQSFTMPKKSPQKDDKDVTYDLQERIKELERALEDEKLRSEAYRLTIEIAEKEFKIPIRKK